MGTPSSITHAYSVFSTVVKELGLRKGTLRQLMAPLVASLNGF
ncbi:hypothetical protein [Candidatus Hodarchaeum mangrovi]